MISDPKGKNAFDHVSSLKRLHTKNVFLGHLNINSLRNKFESIQLLIKDSFDIFLISETKIDSSFPNAQFNIPGYKIFRKDRVINGSNGGGLMFFIKHDIPCKVFVSQCFSVNTEILTVQLNLNKSKILLVGLYKPPSINDEEFLNELQMGISNLSATFDQFVLIGDLNLRINDPKLIEFCENFSLKHLINEPTCFKGENPTQIDHIITNVSSRFMKSCALETGISDHHKMIMTIFRMTIAKGDNKTLNYRCYKKFDTHKFENDLLISIKDSENLKHFCDKFQSVLNLHAPIKKKKIRHNNQPFMTKALRKAIMVRSKLRNIFNCNKSSNNWSKYKRQRNLCVNLLRQNKRHYFNNLNIKSVTDSKKFWKNIKPNFVNENKAADTIILSQNEKIIKDQRIVAEEFNNYFTDITKSLELKKTKSFNSNHSISDIINHFKNSESVIKIKEQCNENAESFSFTAFKKEEIIKILNDLPNKSSILNDIPLSILKKYVYIYSEKLTSIFNNCLNENKFPDILKKADVTPVFKKGTATDKENFRPISTLSHLSKIFERLLYNQIEAFFIDKFSDFLTGFRKNNSTQYALLHMVEYWKTNLNKGNHIGAIFMDLSKAFDTLNHNLLIAKLEAYGFSMDSLVFIKDYLSNRFQRCKIGDHISEWRKIKTGVPQGSILGPLLFNIFINDIFKFVHRSCICNYADDNTLYSFGKNFESIYQQLSFDFLSLKNWYYHNYLVLNPDKCYYMTFGIKKDNENLKIEDLTISNVNEVKVLGVVIDNQLSFTPHIKRICSNANQKLNALFRVSKQMTNEQLNLLVNAFIKSHFNYCPLIWMLCSHHSMNKINKIQERTLRLLYNSYDTTFDELLLISGEVSTHMRCIWFLLAEIYKFINGLSPPIMNEVFTIRENTYNIRNFNIFGGDVPKSNRYGINTIPYLGNKLWNIIPINIRNSPSLECFKSRLRSIKVIDCPCLACRTYIHQLGYI
mgnify:CR=1 FL=1